MSRLALLALILFSGLTSAAGTLECEVRLGYSFTSLVERALERGAIPLQKAVQLAAAPRPFNPLDGVPLRSNNSALYEVFQYFLTMNADTWTIERNKLRAAIEKRSGETQAVAVASRKTADLLAPHLIERLSAPAYGDVKWLAMPNGKVYGAIRNFAGQVEVREFLNPQPIWTEDTPNETKEFFALEINDKGHPQIYYIRHSPMNRMFALLHKNQERFLTRTFDLVDQTSTEQTEYIPSTLSYWGHYQNLRGGGKELYVEGEGEGENAVTVSYPSLVKPIVLSFPPSYTVTAAEAVWTGKGRLFVAVQSRVGTGSVLEVYEPLVSEKPVLTKEYPADCHRVQMSWIKRGGDDFLLVDEDLGLTEIFDPAYGISAMAAWDLSAAKDHYFTVLQGPNQVYLIGNRNKSQQVQIFTLYSKTSVHTE